MGMMLCENPAGRERFCLAAKAKLKFEEAKARLQEIVEKLEGGEESLEGAMKLFEEGAKLSAQCYEALDKAEQKVTQLAKWEDGEDA